MRLIDADELKKKKKHSYKEFFENVVSVADIDNAPTIEAERLTDTEQRIFLAAMRREKTVCKLVDEEGPREPYEKTLVRACNEIIRKVKGALWV